MARHTAQSHVGFAFLAERAGAMRRAMSGVQTMPGRAF
jgi:hypothetical protein